MSKRFVSLSEGIQSLFSFSISYKVGMLPLVSLSNMVQVNAIADAQYTRSRPKTEYKQTTGKQLGKLLVFISMHLITF